MISNRYFPSIALKADKTSELYNFVSFVNLVKRILSSTHAAAFLLDVCTLKYNEAKEKWAKMEENEKKSAKEKLKIMLKFIKKYALYSILDKEIYWKTRVMYLILK